MFLVSLWESVLIKFLCYFHSTTQSHPFNAGAECSHRVVLSTTGITMFIKSLWTLHSKKLTIFFFIELIREYIEHRLFAVALHSAVHMCTHSSISYLYVLDCLQLASTSAHVCIVGFFSSLLLQNSYSFHFFLFFAECAAPFARAQRHQR